MSAQGACRAENQYSGHGQFWLVRAFRAIWKPPSQCECLGHAVCALPLSGHARVRKAIPRPHWATVLTRRGKRLRLLDVRTVARVTVSALITYGLWLASPAIYGDLTGLDRGRAEDAAIDFLIAVVGGAAE